MPATATRIVSPAAERLMGNKIRQGHGGTGGRGLLQERPDAFAESWRAPVSVRGWGDGERAGRWRQQVTGDRLQGGQAATSSLQPTTCNL